MSYLKLLLIGLCAFCIKAHDPMEDPDLVEGDMILSEEQKFEYLFGDANYQIPLAATKTNLWPKTIPYVINEALLDESQAVNAINAAIADFERLTCLKFVKRTKEQGYIRFIIGSGCSSPVGYHGRPNFITLGPRCWSKGIVMHEIAHSLGFHHEQSRPDRDEHVIIHWENIPDKLEPNFKKQPSSKVDSMSVPYDYESVMHYGKKAFGGGKITIETIDKSKQDVIGNRKGFSHFDAKQMNLLYCQKANTTTPAPTPSACVDKRPKNCPSWKKRGYCQRTKKQTLMRKICKKTCGFCSGEASKPPVVTTYAAPFAACSDKRNNCPQLKERGYCQSKRKQKFMRKNCKKTCGYCSGATTKQPVVTTKGPFTGTCGQPEVQQSRVIAGENATRGAWPWQILMLYNGRPGCGGSLISPNWVVTAAHCVSGREGYASSFRVRVAEHVTSTTTDGQHLDVQVQKIISHPSYSRNTINNDIALMKLKTPVLFSKYVKPVCLPNQDEDVPVGTECYITGWGKIKHPGSMHHTLQQGKMPVVSKANCTAMNTKNLGIKITDQMVCAGHGGKTRVSGCHGDSGGPFVCQTGANGRWVLHGAVSWGSGRCDATQGYTVFARIAKFRSWINQQMAKN